MSHVGREEGVDVELSIFGSVALDGLMALFFLTGSLSSNSIPYGMSQPLLGYVSHEQWGGGMWIKITLSRRVVDELFTVVNANRIDSDSSAYVYVKMHGSSSDGILASKVSVLTEYYHDATNYLPQPVVFRLSYCGWLSVSLSLTRENINDDQVSAFVSTVPGPAIDGWTVGFCSKHRELMESRTSCSQCEKTQGNPGEHGVFATEVSITLPFLEGASIDNLPEELIQSIFLDMCRGFPFQGTGQAALKSLRLVCRRWYKSVVYPLKLATLPTHGQAEELRENVQVAASRISSAVIRCNALHSIFIDPTLWGPAQTTGHIGRWTPDFSEAWDFLYTLFSLTTNIRTLRICGPLSSGIHLSAGDKVNESLVSATRNRVWKYLEEKLRKLESLTLDWDPFKPLDGTGKIPEPRWSVDDYLYLAHPETQRTYNKDFRFTLYGAYFSESPYLVLPSNFVPFSGTIRLWDCAVTNKVLSGISKYILPSEIGLVACIGPGRLDLEGISNFLKPRMKTLQQIDIGVLPWREEVLEEGIFQLWIHRNGSKSWDLNLIFQENNDMLEEIMVDGGYDELLIFSSPLIIPSPSPLRYVKDIGLFYCSELQPNDVATIIESTPKLQHLSISILFGDWGDESQKLSQDLAERFHAAHQFRVGSWFKFKEGVSSAHEGWDGEIGKNWTSEEVQEQLESWRRRVAYQ